MKTLKRIGASLLAWGLISPVLSWADPAVVRTFEEPSPQADARPTTVVDFLPWYAVPDRYLFSGGYFMHLNITEMRIDHVANNSRCTPRNRMFMISASFAQPIGHDLFSSRFELPLVSADRLNVARLRPAAVGDYVAHFSNAPLSSAVLGISLTARF